ncbi:MAG TPA: T9SS type A sorting domain-containing protein [Bacteroidia bacterium]|nr:T9SS type A sorting domain-containing protein [Bacteroidia bacterium]
MKHKILLLLVLFQMSLLPAFSVGFWAQLNSFPGTPRTDAVSFTINNIVYYGTGFHIDHFTLQQVYDKDIWAFDPFTQAWTQKADFIGTGVYGAYAFSANGNGFIGGGQSAAGVGVDFGKYDPVSNSWQNLSGQSHPSRIYASVFTINAVPYVVGGTTGLFPSNAMSVFNPATGAFSNAPPIGGTSYPNPGEVIRYGASTFSVNGKGYVGCGVGYDAVGNLVMKNDLWEYDPSTQQWTQKLNFPGTARSFAAGFAADGNGYIGMGTNTVPPGGNYYSDFWKYDAQLNTWTADAAIPYPGYSACPAEAGGVSYVIGGTVTAPGVSLYMFIPPCALSTPVITASGSTAICSGGSVVLSTAAVSGASYQWLRDGLGISGANSTSVTATLPGIYTVRINTSIYCNATSAGTTVTVEPAPSGSIAANGSTGLCSGASVTLDLTASGSNLSYQWNLNGSPIGGATSTSYTASTPGSYSVTIQNNCGSATTNSIQITTALTPTVAVAAGGSTALCNGAAVVLNSTVNDPGVTYQWQLNSSAIPGGTTASYTANTAGSYNVVVTNNCGSSQSNSIAVTTNNTPTVSCTAGGPTTFCQGSSVTLNSSVTGTGITYQWRKNSSPISGATAASYSASAQGTYDVAATNSCGSSTSNGISVSLLTAPTASIGANGPTTFCAGGSVTLNASPTGTGYTYQWKLNGGTISGATNSSLLVSASGNYSAVVTNGCGSNTSNVITVTANGSSGPTASISAAGSTTFCSGGSVVLNSTVTGSGISYQWRLNGNSISGATGASTTATQDGNYDLAVYNICGTAISNSITVTVSTGPPSRPGNISGSSKFCSNEQGVPFSISPVSNATSYLWNVPSGATVATGQGTTDITVNFGNNNGTIEVFAVNACGVSQSRTKNVSKNNHCRTIADPADISINNNVLIYPNPASGVMHLQLQVPSADYAVLVRDITGKICFSKSISTQTESSVWDIDTSLFPEGMYVVIIEGDDYRSLSKILIQH